MTSTLTRFPLAKNRGSAHWCKPSRNVPTEQIKVQLGPRVIDSATDLHAVFDVDDQREANTAIKAVIDAIVERLPNACAATPSTDGIQHRIEGLTA